MSSEELVAEEPIVSLLTYYFFRSERERKRVERLLYRILHDRPLLIQGFFGEGKTRSAALAARRISEMVLRGEEERLEKITIIFGAPLRRLRDEIHRRYFFDCGFKLMAHDEVCPALRARLAGARDMDYLMVLAEHIKNDNCLYPDHIDALREALRKRYVVVTTHSLAFLAALMARSLGLRPIVILDEAEDIIEKLGKGLDEDVVEAIRNIDPKLYNKIRRMMKKEQSKYYMRFSTLRAVMRDAVLLSATFPKAVSDNYELLFGVELNTSWIFSFSRDVKDYMIIYRGKLLWKKYEKWKPLALRQLVEIVRAGVDKHGVVGVVSRNYRMTQDIENVLKELGYEAVSDLDPDFQSAIADAEVIVLTTKGKLYRGVNILRQAGDIPIVFGFYQAMEPREHYPQFVKSLLDGAGEAVFEMYVREMTYAKNLQALYRFIRRQSSSHVIVLFDWRFHEAFYHFFRNKLYERFVRVEVDDIEKIADVAKQYI